jgi:hypothetical protein
MKKKQLTILLAAAAVTVAMRAPAHADDAPSPRPDERMVSPPSEYAVPPTYNQIPRDYDEFVEVYNKVMTFLRANDVPSQHKCYPAGASPYTSYGWCNDMMKWGDPKGRRIAVIEVHREDGTEIKEFCFGDKPTERRCFQDNGVVADQALDTKRDLYFAYRNIAAAWNERGKPLSDLTPGAARPPAAAPSPPAAAPSPPAAASVVPPKFNQIPNSYDEFAAVYNKALAFLRGTGAQSVHKCHPVGADPSNPNHGWCSDQVFWGDPKGQHIFAVDLTQDDGKHSVMLCLGDDLNTQRCYRDDGAVFDEHNDRKIDLWVTFSTVAGAWNERGKPLAGLTPHGKRETKR